MADREKRIAQQKKRAFNRRQSTGILRKNNIPFRSLNNGGHLILHLENTTVDFWPGTGKWIDRKNPETQHRGVFKLLEFIEQCQTTG